MSSRALSSLLAKLLPKPLPKAAATIKDLVHFSGPLPLCKDTHALSIMSFDLT